MNNNWSSIGEYLDTILKTKRKINIINLISGDIQIEKIKKNGGIFEGIIKRFILKDISLFSNISSFNLRKYLGFMLTPRKMNCSLDSVFTQASFLEHKVEKTNNQVSIKLGKDLLIVSENFKIPDVKIKFEGNTLRKSIIKRCKYEIPLGMIHKDTMDVFFLYISKKENEVLKEIDAWKNAWVLNKSLGEEYRVVQNFYEKETYQRDDRGKYKKKGSKYIIK